MARRRGRLRVWRAGRAGFARAAGFRHSVRFTALNRTEIHVNAASRERQTVRESPSGLLPGRPTAGSPASNTLNERAPAKPRRGSLVSTALRAGFDPPVGRCGWRPPVVVVASSKALEAGRLPAGGMQYKRKPGLSLFGSVQVASLERNQPDSQFPDDRNPTARERDRKSENTAILTSS